METMCNILPVRDIPVNSLISDDSGGKESACSAGNRGDMGSFPGCGRFSGGGNGSPLQYACLENPMHRGAWRVTVQGVVKELDTT